MNWIDLHGPQRGFNLAERGLKVGEILQRKMNKFIFLCGFSSRPCEAIARRVNVFSANSAGSSERSESREKTRDERARCWVFLLIT